MELLGKTVKDVYDAAASLCLLAVRFGSGCIRDH